MAEAQPTKSTAPPPWYSWKSIKDDILKPLFSEIPLPREAIIVNIRLGIFNRVLQVLAIIGAVFVVLLSVDKQYPVSNIDVEINHAYGNVSNGNVDHCSNPGKYNYTYKTGYRYTPSGCKELENEDVLKTADTMFFMTMLEDTATSTASGINCMDWCQNQNLMMVSQVGGKCTCRDAFFVKNQEKNEFGFRHTVQVMYGKSEFRAVSDQNGWTDELSNHHSDGKVMTRIKKAKDGSLCEVGGKSKWLPSDHIDNLIKGSIEDWLKCADISLDGQEDEARSNSPGESGAPYVRLTGAKLTLQLVYKNTNKLWYDKDDDIDGKDVIAACDVMVSAEAVPAWNSIDIVDYTLMGDRLNGDTSTMQKRNRVAHGIQFTFSKGGSFRYFEWLTFIGGLVNAVVIIGVPLQITRYIALYGIGVVSQIYSSVLRQRFSIFHQFHGLAARMMVCSISYRALTDQWTERVDKLKSMTIKDIEKRMVESFNKDLKDASKNNDDTGLDLDEVRMLAHVVVAGLDTSGEGKVSFDEFVHACSSNEHMDTRTMIKFFDDERKAWCIERLFDPTQSEIREVINAKKKLQNAQMAAIHGEEATTHGAIITHKAPGINIVSGSI